MQKRVRIMSGDMVGKRYGRLEVLEVFKSRVMLAICKCDCGNRKDIRTTSLKQGTIKSCGCLNSELSRNRCLLSTVDLAGRSFCKWTVVKKEETTGVARWLCRCQCGAERNVLSNNLLKGVSNGCGCGRTPYNKLSQGESAANSLFHNYRRGAKSRGLVFELSKELFIAMIRQDCNYCGIPPKQVMKTKSSMLLYNGIDRVDNNLGYLPSNVVPSCKKCNETKRALSKEEFFRWIISIYHRIPKEVHADKTAFRDTLMTGSS